MIDTVLLIAKEPRPGLVKTRLAPPLTYEQAAALAAAALHDAVAVMARCAVRRRVVVLDGAPGDWIPAGFEVLAQVSGGLDRRLVAAFDAVRGGGPALLIGMDTPQLRAEHLGAFDPARFDACIGPATDGGYWSIGFRDPARARETITGVPMSDPDTGREQRNRLAAAGLTVQELGELADVDTYPVACEVAAVAPLSHFARRLAQIHADGMPTVRAAAG